MTDQTDQCHTKSISVAEKGNVVALSYHGIEPLLHVHGDGCSVSARLLATRSFYEEPFLECLSLLLTNGAADLVLDIGAHIGNHTVFFAKVCRARVIAFEPSARSYGLLQANVAENHLEDRVTAIQSAIGAEEGIGHLRALHGDDLGTYSLLQSDTNELAVDSTEIRSLDGFAEELDLTGLVLMKIDVEGFEVQVLRGALQTIATYKPVITTEVTDVNDFTALNSLLSNIGYRPLAVMNPTPTVVWVTDHHVSSRAKILSRVQEAGARNTISQALEKNRLSNKFRKFQVDSSRQLDDTRRALEKARQALSESQQALSQTQRALIETQQARSETRKALSEIARKLFLRRSLSRHLWNRLNGQIESPVGIKRLLRDLVRRNLLPRDTMARRTTKRTPTENGIPPAKTEVLPAKTESFPQAIESELADVIAGDVVVLCSAYPGGAREYGGEFIRTRVEAYVSAGIRCAVIELSKLNQTPSFTPSDGQSPSVLRLGMVHQDALAGKLGAGVARVAVHAPWHELQTSLEASIDHSRLIYWFHGAEVRDYRRLAFNYTTGELAVLRDRLDRINEMRFAAARTCFANPKISKVFVSKFLRDIAERDCGARAVNAHIIPNFIDGDTYRPENKSPEDAKRILLVRFFGSRNYGNDIAIQAIRLLRDRPGFDDLHFTIRGFGRYFEPLAQRLAGLPNVDLVEQYSTIEDMAALHRTHGVFLCPSRHDTQGVTMGEAMASGLACITNRVAAIPEFIDDQSGVLVPPDDPKAFADAIWQLTSQPERVLDLSTAAAKRVRSQCGREQTIDREINLIRGA